MFSLINLIDGSTVHMLLVRVAYTIAFSCLMTRRSHFYGRAFIALGITLASIYGIHLAQQAYTVGSWRPVILAWSGICMLCVAFCYRAKVEFYIFWVLLAMVAEGCVESISRLLLITENIPNPVLQTLVGWLLVIFTGCAVFWFMVRKSPQAVSNTNFPKPLFFTIVGILLIMFSLVNTEQTAIYPQFMPAFQGLMNLLALCLLYIFEVEYNLRDDYRHLDELLEKDRLRYEAARDYTNLINIKFHDIKHQIHKIKNESHMDPAFIQELEDALQQYDSNLHTGNQALDIILTEKSRLCIQRNIELTVIADGSPMKHITASDIYSLFGNILDNAIEATCQLPEDRMRHISLVVEIEAGVIRIRQQNYFTGELKTLGDQLLTTKKDDVNHGFGMKSVHYIVEKYNGVLRTEADGNIFTTNILLPLEGK